MFRLAYLVIILIAGFSFMFCGCASTGVVQVDKDTYMLGTRSPQCGFGPPIRVTGNVYREASAFCAKQNKKVETIKMETTNAGFARPGSVVLRFRCVSDGSQK